MFTFEMQSDAIGKHRKRLPSVRALSSITAFVALLCSSSSHAQDVQVLSGGFGYMCALQKTEGTVRCWGASSKGGSTTQSNLPHAPLAMDGIVSIAAAGGAACALRNDGAVLCWGNNNYYMVGDASIQHR